MSQESNQPQTENQAEAKLENQAEANPENQAENQAQAQTKPEYKCNCPSLSDEAMSEEEIHKHLKAFKAAHTAYIARKAFKALEAFAEEMAAEKAKQKAAQNSDGNGDGQIIFALCQRCVLPEPTVVPSKEVLEDLEVEPVNEANPAENAKHAAENAKHAAENAKIDAEMKRYQANRAFLDAVAQGEYASSKALAEEAKAAKAARKYPFQGCTFERNPQTFQPQLTTPSYGRSSEPW